MAYFLVGRDNSSLFSRRTTWDFQDAVAAAADGDIIEIEENFVSEIGSIVIDKNVSIIGKIIENEQPILPTLVGSLHVKNSKVILNNLSLNNTEPKRNCLTIKQGSSVELDTVILESNQVEGDIYPICYAEESTIYIRESAIRTTRDENIHRIYFQNSSVFIQNTNLNVQTMSLGQ